MKSRQIRKAVGELDQLRQKSEELLYSMIPRQVADRLKNGEESVNTWEVNSLIYEIDFQLAVYIFNPFPT